MRFCSGADHGGAGHRSRQSSFIPRCNRSARAMRLPSTTAAMVDSARYAATGMMMASIGYSPPLCSAASKAARSIISADTALPSDPMVTLTSPPLRWSILTQPRLDAPCMIDGLAPRRMGQRPPQPRAAAIIRPNRSAKTPNLTDRRSLHFPAIACAPKPAQYPRTNFAMKYASAIGQAACSVGRSETGTNSPTNLRRTAIS